jgi:hypothetical protein
MDDQGGWLWAVINIAFVAGLGAALAYGIFAWRRRSRDRAVEQVRDLATLRNYEQGGSRPEAPISSRAPERGAPVAAEEAGPSGARKPPDSVAATTRR